MQSKLRVILYIILIISLKLFKINCEYKKKTPNYSIFDLFIPDKFIESYDQHYSDHFSDSPPPTYTVTQQTTTSDLTFSNELQTETPVTETNPPILIFTRPTGPPVQMTNKPTVTPETITISKGPQSLTIFMNFQNDGTTSIQALNENSLNWFDLGNCRHGQIFDSILGICREVFCLEGYIFTAQGCIQTNETSIHNEPIKKPSPEMNIEITIANKLCSFIKDYNDTVKCDYQLSMQPNDEFIQNLKFSFSKFLGINNERISNFSVMNHSVLNHTIFNLENKNKIQAHRLGFLNSSSFQKIDLSTTETNEFLKLRFLINDRKLFDKDEKETITLFYYLVMHSMDKKYLNIIANRDTYFSDVLEIRSSPEQGWCKSKGDQLNNFRDNFHVLASFDELNNPKYYVYANQTDTLYGTGYFQLSFIVYNLKFSQPKANQDNYESRNHSINHHTWIIKSDKTQIISDHYLNVNQSDYLNITLKLYDVTEVFFPQNSSDLSKLLYVCHIAPKIRIECKNYQTVRIKLCELEKMRDGSYCSYLTNVCYSIDEYEYDALEPDEFIRVCENNKYIKPNNTFENNNDTIKKLKDRYKIMAVIPGWVSVFATIISITGLIVTLVTYLLFNELRNIPGWNIINLTFALILAQVSFTCGSFFNHLALLCFIISLLTHYGYLASFLWMNVIAFDLFRNFRDKSSHVLLQAITVKSRLPKYALFGWLSPLVIVLTGLIIDIVIKEPKKNTPFRPCYAGYLTGCKDYQVSSSKILNKNSLSYEFILRNNQSEHRNYTDLFESCYESYKTDYNKVIVLNNACWMQNGKANLIFFGLPIAIIIIINAVFFFLTVYNIRQKKSKQKKSLKTRFSKAKLPTDQDVGFYIRISGIMGFTWLIGFFLTTLNPENQSHEIIYQILIYIFILLNGSVGLFIFFAFIFKRETKELYKMFLLRNVFYHFMSKDEKEKFNNYRKKTLVNHFKYTTSRSRQFSDNSASSGSLFDGVKRTNQTKLSNKTSISTISYSNDSFQSSPQNVIIESDEGSKENSINNNDSFRYSTSSSIINDEVFIANKKDTKDSHNENEEDIRL